MARVLIHNIGELVTPIGRKARHGPAMNQVSILRKAAIYIENGCIMEVGDSEQLLRKYHQSTQQIDAAMRCAIPGFIDPHTHFLFAGQRAGEFVSRLEGVPYLKLLEQGGGICQTMKATRLASSKELLQQGRDIVHKMLHLGVTTMEGKSGYGLDRETELRQLQVMKELNEETPMTIKRTFLGAHAVPPEFKGRSSDYVEFLLAEMLPLIRQEKLADFCDVFCETGVFSLAESERLLRGGQAIGLKAKIHADEINSTGGAGLAAQLGAISADHLLSIAPQDIVALASSNTVAVLLPATAFCMRKPFAPAREMIRQGCAVALASDFNPGSCYTYSIPLILGLAVISMKMTLAEALTALTLNAAAAIDESERLGSIEPGKQADILLLADYDVNSLVYQTGINQVEHVIKNGRMLW